MSDPLGKRQGRKDMNEKATHDAMFERSIWSEWHERDFLTVKEAAAVADRLVAEAVSESTEREAAALAKVAALTAAVLDIDAHATPFGTDADGFVNGGYLISVGCLHRALGIVGHPAAPCLSCEASTHDCEVQQG